MTGQHNPLTNYCLQTILTILILHRAAISCAPLPERTARETCNRRNFRYEVIVDEGSSFMQDEIIPSVYPQYNDQVCSLIFLYCTFNISAMYSSMYLTLGVCVCFCPMPYFSDTVSLYVEMKVPTASLQRGADLYKK